MEVLVFDCHICLFLLYYKIHKQFRHMKQFEQMSKKLQHQCYSKAYFQPSIQLNLHSLIFKDFFGWVNFSIYVEKRSCITIYNRIVL